MYNNGLNTMASLGDSESSYDCQGNQSINNRLDSLCLNRSWDSYKSEEEDDEVIPRGKPGLVKVHSTGRLNTKKSTSQFVLPLMHGTSDSSGYSSSISPSSDNAISNHQPAVIPNFNDRQNMNFVVVTSEQSTKRYLQNKIFTRIFQKTKKDSTQSIFDFEDTELIKSCRRGQVAAVEASIKKLLDTGQYQLINHQNSGKETALSIATYQMHEVIINLLIKSRAIPDTKLSMGNNVLHIAADLTADKDRKTFGYLINAIREYQPDKLWSTLTARNIFNYDPISILTLHSKANFRDPGVFQALQRQISSAQQVLKSLIRYYNTMECRVNVE